MASVAAALRQVKDDPARVLAPETIEAACRGAGHRWRHRVLDPVETVHTMVLQALHGNAPIGEVVRLKHEEFTGAAFCRARQRLPLEVLVSLFHQQHRQGLEILGGQGATGGRWRGHRTWLLDSTGFSMPDTPELQAFFGQSSTQRTGCGFPVARTLVLFDWYSSLLLDFIPAPLDTGEAVLAALAHTSMNSGDIILADCNFGTFGQLSLAQRRGIHAVFEMHVVRRVSFRKGARLPGAQVIRKLGPNDQLSQWKKPRLRPRWMDKREFAALPETITVREIRRQVRTAGSRKREITLVTTLLDANAYPADAVVELYSHRWQIEGAIRTLKHTLKLDVLRCKSVHGVLKELVAIVLVHNMVRLIMLDAADRQNVPPQRVSFIDALRWWRWAEPGATLCTLRVNPLRPGRYEPRVQKRRPKAYPAMITPRSVLKARLLRGPPVGAK